MDFALHYEGPLPSAQGGGDKSAARMGIRRAVHAQLADLWTREPLTRFRRYWGGALVGHTPDLRPQDVDSILPQYRIDRALGSRIFVPLVNSVLLLRARIEITLLLPGGGEADSHDGDLDNRIKFLFDALRLPEPGHMTDFIRHPWQGEGAIFTLLEDDRLVAGYSLMRTHRLLGAGNADDVHLVLEVSMFPSRLTGMNIGL